jgi:hypothetical protein
MKNNWEPFEGQYRVCVSGPLGIHQTKPFWDLKVAEKKQKLFQEPSWIEVFEEGKWRKVF